MSILAGVCLRVRACVCVTGCNYNYIQTHYVLVERGKEH